jgi:hypothetical protein
MSAPPLSSVRASPAVYFLLSTFWTGDVLPFWVRGYASVMAFAFEKLTVYQKAVAFADTVCTLTKGFPRRVALIE